MKVNIVIEKDDYGYYAFCPEMKGCHSQGDSLDEVLANIKEAVELYLEVPLKLFLVSTLKAVTEIGSTNSPTEGGVPVRAWWY